MTGSGSVSPDSIVFRRLTSQADYEACIELPRPTWGRDFSDAVPLSIQKIIPKVGGVVAGAFSPDGQMLAFVMGLTGWREGRPIHWSHMLAVAPEARDLGLGTRLKLYQRELLLPLGVEEVEWTFDPLEARNAHLNFNHLGAGIASYVRDMYEGELWSDLARGIGTDRLIASWKIAGERVERALGGEPPDASRFRDAPVANPAPGEEPPAPGVPRVRIEVPADVQAVKEAHPEEGRAWRMSTRRAFEFYLGRDYRVEAFFRDPETGRCFYGLEH
jgi:predicted GNAT superfamily acetyltransferase